MATRPKNPKAATKGAAKGRTRRKPSPASDPAKDTSAAVSADKTDSQISKLEESASTDDAAPPESENSVPGVILAHATTSPLPVAPPPRTTATAGLVFGGLIAGAIGFLAATFLPNVWSDQSVDTTASLSASLDAQSARIDELTSQVSSLADGGETDLTPLNDQLADLNGRVADRSDALAAQLDQLAARLETLEARPIISLPDGSDAMAAQLDAFRSELDAVTNAARAEIEEAKAHASEIEAEAAAVAASAQRRAALAEIDAALENGAPFANTLTALKDAPSALAAVAEKGVPTLAALRATFPELARAALTSIDDPAENAGAGEKLASFLRRQTNARSLSPRDGDDVDAILSRAEASLQGGGLLDALAEIETLPEASREVLAPWIAAAETRAAALSAFAAMSEILN